MSAIAQQKAICWPWVWVKRSRQAQLARKREQQEARSWIAQLRLVTQQLEELETVFNLTGDPDLLEGCIYQRKALQARYRYLAQHCRRQKICCDSGYYALEKGR